MNELVADIGGTGSRLAILQAGQVLASAEYRNAEFHHFTEILKDFLASSTHRPDRAALAVAGPVADGKVHMTNLGWDLDAAEISREFRFSELCMVNDFVAVAWATELLQLKDLHHLGGPQRRTSGNRVVVGAGTGFGVSALVTDDENWTAVPGEGGHLSMAASNPLEAALVASAIGEFGRCSAERLLSGAGLSRIYRHISEQSCSPEEVVARANRREHRALEAVEVFAGLLADVAGDLALIFGARGGVFIGGGIVPANLKLFANSGFRQRFEAKGRYRSYLADIPCWVITAKNPGLLGLSHLLSKTANRAG